MVWLGYLMEMTRQLDNYNQPMESGSSRIQRFPVSLCQLVGLLLPAK
jgi:hypothetical protein